MLPQMISRLERIAWPLSKAVAALGSVCLMLMMTITTIDVLGRNILGMSIQGTLEIVSMCLVMTLFGGLAYAALQDCHIQVDILTEKFSPAVQRSLSVVIHALYLAVVVVLAWQCLEQAEFLFKRNTNTGIVAIPLWPFMFMVGVSLVLFCFTIVISLLRSVVRFYEEKEKSFVFALLLAAVSVFLMVISLEPDLSPVYLDESVTGILSLVILFGYIFLGLPIGAAMAFATLAGLSHLVSAEAGLSLLGMVSKTVASNYGWSVAPLFVFMGILVSACRFSQDIFDTAYKWLGHLSGGLASATIGACAVFAAVVGDSLSGVVTMGSIALPEMKKYKYNTRLSTGCVAVGGSLGILIPPSMGFIVYGLMTEQSIGKLFMAGLIPGVIVTVMLITMITVRCKLDPTLGPAGERSSWNERIRFTIKSWPVLSLFLVVLGGIWLGLFTPTEAGAIGVFVSLLIGLVLHRFGCKDLTASLMEAIKLISSIFFIFIYATAFTQYIAVTMLPNLLASGVAGLPVGRYGVLIVIMLIYLLLGCVMNALPVIILTLPILYPSVLAMGFDPIWFGVVVVILAELGQITPPIGISVFALRNVVPDVPLFTIFAGTLPFWGVFILLIALITIFPQLALFLPNLLFG